MHGCDEAILERLDDWRERLTPETIAAAGAEGFPPAVAGIPR
jgi:hypothetical protein